MHPSCTDAFKDKERPALNALHTLLALSDCNELLFCSTLKTTNTIENAIVL